MITVEELTKIQPEKVADNVQNLDFINNISIEELQQKIIDEYTHGGLFINCEGKLPKETIDTLKDAGYNVYEIYNMKFIWAINDKLITKRNFFGKEYETLQRGVKEKEFDVYSTFISWRSIKHLLNVFGEVTQL